MTVCDVVIWLHVRGFEEAKALKNPLTFTMVHMRPKVGTELIEFETATGELLWIPIASIAWVEIGLEREA